MLKRFESLTKGTYYLGIMVCTLSLSKRSASKDSKTLRNARAYNAIGGKKQESRSKRRSQRKRVFRQGIAVEMGLLLI